MEKTALFFSLHFVLSHSPRETFTPLPSACVLTEKERGSFLFIIFKNIIFILWDTLSQVKGQLPLNLIQNMWCGENDTVRQYKC